MNRLFVAVLFLSLAGARVASAQGLHTVRPGDTLFDLAIQYGTTVAALTWANRIPQPDLIAVGLELRLPEPICPPQPPTPERGDPNRCYDEWSNCGDGSTPESECWWKIGWCMANLDLDVTTCACRLCSRCPEDPEEPEDPPEEPDADPPVEEAVEPRCVLETWTDENGVVHRSARALFLYKLCLDNR